MSVAGSGAGSAVGGAAEGWSGSSPAATVDFVTRSWEVSVSVAGSGAGFGAAEGWSGSSFAADVDFGAVEAGVVTGSAVGVAVVVGCGSAPVARSGSCAATTAVVPDGAAGPGVDPSRSPQAARVAASMATRTSDRVALPGTALASGRVPSASTSGGLTACSSRPACHDTPTSGTGSGLLKSIPGIGPPDYAAFSLGRGLWQRL